MPAIVMEEDSSESDETEKENVPAEPVRFKNPRYNVQELVLSRFWELLIVASILLAVFSIYSTTYILDNVCVELRNPNNSSESGVVSYRLFSGTTAGYAANYKTSRKTLQLTELRIYRWVAPMQHRLVASLCSDCNDTEKRYCEKRGLPSHCNRLGSELVIPDAANEMIKDTLSYRFKMRFNTGEEWWSDGPGHNCPHFIYAVETFVNHSSMSDL